MVISEKIHLKGRPQPSILGYHPTNLCYRLIEENDFLIKHPKTIDGDNTPVVGVHNIVTMVPWESNPGGYRYSGALLWHLAELSNWQETQKEFSSASPETKRKALAVGPVFNKGRWGTHFGGTMSILTSDGYTVFRSRKGKYAETQSYDSILTGTMLTSDISNSLVPNTMDYLLSLLSDANISLLHDVEEFHPTHLAVRASDFGL